MRLNFFFTFTKFVYFNEPLDFEQYWGPNIEMCYCVFKILFRRFVLYQIAFLCKQLYQQSSFILFSFISRFIPFSIPRFIKPIEQPILHEFHCHLENNKNTCRGVAPYVWGIREVTRKYIIYIIIIHIKSNIFTH